MEGRRTIFYTETNVQTCVLTVKKERRNRKITGSLKILATDIAVLHCTQS
jgi:hypothetical protein